MSFECDACHFKNTDVQAAGTIQEQGTKFTFKIETAADLQRQIVKSDTAVFRIEDLDLEIPKGRGRLTNVEGILMEVAADLETDQDRREKDHPDLFAKLNKVISEVKNIAQATGLPVTISLDDTAGNSMIEPSPMDGPKYSRKEYKRNATQNASLGLADTAGTAEGADNGTGVASVDPSMEGLDILEGQIYTFPCDCPGCTKPAAINMQMVNIPYFKQVIITAVTCDHCEYRSNEVKTGGEVPKQGQRIWLDVERPEDLSRDILKSETCCLKIEECGVEVQPGTMGGRFTTVEGLLSQMRDDLRSSIFDIDDEAGGDSMPSSTKSAWQRFFSKLDEAIHAKIKYTILLEDPLANSYVQSVTAPEPDPQIRSESYDRTEEEEDDLGILHMRTHLNEHGEYVREDELTLKDLSLEDKTNAPLSSQGDGTS